MKISVCITHYNRPHRLEATLASLARQTRQPDEVFLWDDASPQDPTEIAQSYRARFPHFIYHRNPKNLGMPGNLNAVIAQAQGDLVANLHDADEFDPTLLEKWEAALIKHPDAGLVFCGLDAASKSPGKGLVWIHDIPEYSEGHEFFRRTFVGTSGSPIWGTVMVRRSVYARHFPFDPQFQNWADVDMWMRICGTHGVCYVAEPLIALDDSPSSVRSFTWEKFLIVHRMPAMNIHRMAANEAELRDWLRRQQRWTRGRYLRHLGSRLLRGKIGSFMDGLRIWRDVLVRMFQSEWRLAETKPVCFVCAPERHGFPGAAVDSNEGTTDR